MVTVTQAVQPTRFGSGNGEESPQEAPLPLFCLLLLQAIIIQPLATVPPLISMIFLAFLPG